MTLKTLKGIEDGAGKDGKADGLIVFRYDLKQEAIKWYKKALKQNEGIPKNAITTSDWLEFFNITDEDLK